MSAVLRIVTNSSFVFVMNLTTKAARALVFILVARYLGPVESGILTIALSYQAIFQSFTLAGTDYLLVREVAKDRSLASNYFTHLAVMKIVLSIVSGVILFAMLSTVLHHSPRTGRVIMLLALIILPEGIGEACRALFVALGRLLIPAAIAFVVDAAKLVASYMLLVQGASIEAVVLVVVTASVVKMGASLAFVFSHLTKPVWPLRWSFFRAAFSNLSAFASMGILRILEYHITILMLSYIRGEREVGIYNSAYTLILAVLMISQAYISGAMPAFSRLYSQSRHSRLALLYHTSVWILWIVALPIVLVLLWLSPQLVLNIYTFEYEGAVSVFRILSPLIPLTLFLAPHTCVMLATNLQGWVVWVLSGSILTNILTGALLIPRYGATGAAVARLTATVLIAVVYYIIILYTKTVRVKALQVVGGLTLAAGLAVGIGWMLQDVSIWLALLVGGTAYLIMIALVIVFSEECYAILQFLRDRKLLDRH